MPHRTMKRALAALLCTLLHVAILPAGEAPIRVGLFDLPPFVMPDGHGGHQGFALELWQEVAKKLELEVEYTSYDTVGNLFSAVADGREDVAVTALTINTERAKWCKFSFPWYESGLSIMVREGGGGIWHELRQNRYIRFYVLFILVMCVLSFLMTLVRRKKEDDFPEDWKHGFFLSLYNLMVLIREGRLDKKFQSWKGNLLSVLWTLFGVAAVAYVTSTLTAAMMAVSRDHGVIAGVEDLGGKKVGVLEGGLAKRYLDKLQIHSTTVKNMDEAAELLNNGRLDAFVGDFPVLNYWTHNNRDKGLKVVGNTFHPEKFGFAVNRGMGDLTERITMALIHLHDDGTTEKLAANYYLEYSGTRLRQ